MDEDMRIISTTKELKVFSDPFRLNIINVFRENHEPLTVKGCADILNEFPSKVSYHVKKLIDIDVLELDHVEVINGINAKYYKLSHEKFKIQIKEDTEDVVRKNVDYVNSIVISQIEQFKVDFLNMSQRAINDNVKESHEVGLFSNNKIYLSKEEYHELEAYMMKFIQSHNEKDESKNKYSFAFGIANMFAKKNK